jgi:predicted enzyme related to lactoylglutathione lyase
MTNRHGSFIWYELMTSDAAAAERFYGDIIGWRAEPFGGGGMDYRVVHAGDEAVGGIMEMPATAASGGMKPGWFGYIGVDDVDAAAAGIEAAGGTVHAPPQDIPGVGRFAMVADPQGVTFYIMRGSSDEESRAHDGDAVGHCAWNELATSDPEAALAFYRAQFGMEPGDAMDMGEMGSYQFIDHGGKTIGAVMRQMPGGPPPMWDYYFRVPSIAAVLPRIEAGGGKLIHGPHEVPGGDYIVMGTDPQGALFHLVGKQ